MKIFNTYGTANAGYTCHIKLHRAWNFLWPLLVLQDPKTYSLTVGLYDLKGTFVTNTRLADSSLEKQTVFERLNYGI